jgi:blocked-early-in-transport protein 1
MLGKKGANRVFRGQYSDAVLNELESQNDGQVEGIMGKVRQLKDVCFFLCSVGELC